MSFKCKYCGRELPDGAAFCEGCGTTFDTDKIPCLSCGELLDPGTTLCPVCGSRIYNTAAEAGPAEMEELIPPVITDDMFTAQAPVSNEAPAIESADESVYMHPAAAAPQQPAPAQTGGTAPQPYIPRRPEPIPVPIRPRQQAPAQSAPLLNRPRQSASPGVQQPAPAYEDQQSYASNRSSGFAEAARPQQQPQQPQQPQMPFQDFAQKPYPDPARMQMQENKKEHSMLVPVILIILIVAVILVDVFVLFRDRIFGSDDSKSSKSAAVIRVIDDLPADTL